MSGPRSAKEPGSVEWCLQTVSLLQIRWSQTADDGEEFHKVLDEIKAERAWRKIPPGAPYGSMKALLIGELGIPRHTADGIQRKHTTLARHGTNQHPGHYDHNVLAPAQQGTSGDYLLGRLRRDAPAVAERYERGEFSSVAAAARAGGIVKPERRRLRALPADDMADCARYLRERLSADQCAELARLLLNGHAP